MSVPCPPSAAPQGAGRRGVRPAALMGKEIIKELRGKKMLIHDDRPESESLSLNEWDFLTIPFPDGSKFRSLVLPEDLESAVAHAFLAAEMAHEDGLIMNLQDAHLIRVDYKTALQWELVAGVTGVDLV